MLEYLIVAPYIRLVRGEQGVCLASSVARAVLQGCCLPGVRTSVPS